MPKLIVGLTAAALLGYATVVSAAPFYQAFNDTFVGPSCLQQGGTPATCSIDITLTNNPLPGSTQAFADAGPSSLAVFVSLDMAGHARDRTRERQTMASAFMGFDDFIVSGPDSATFVVASMNLDVHGSFDADASILSGTPFARTESLLVLDAAVEDPFGNLPFRRGRIAMVADTRNPQTSFNPQGDFRLPFNIPLGASDFPFVSLLFAMPVGREFRVEVFLRADVISIVAGSGEGSSAGTVDLRNTLTFPGAGLPVFDLPDGFTVNSVQAQIQNNTWIGAQQIPPIDGRVPEPASLALLGVALAALGFARRRKAA